MQRKPRTFLTLLTTLTLFFCSMPAFSQGNNTGGGEYFEDSFRDISIVGATAAGGAILGASTLSFVDEPGDHLKNIVVGLAIGIVVGVGIVAYMAATKNKNIYENNAYLSPNKDLNFATVTRMKWHVKEHNSKNLKLTNPSLVGYQFSF